MKTTTMKQNKTEDLLVSAAFYFQCGKILSFVVCCVHFVAAILFIVVTADDPDVSLEKTSGIISYSIGATLFWLASCFLLSAKHYTAEHKARTKTS